MNKVFPDFTAAKAAVADDPVTALVAEFNNRYMVVNEAGKAVIYEPAYDPLLNRKYFTRITFEDLHKLYLNRMVPVSDKKSRPAADVWLEHRDRRQFIGGVVFDPSEKHVPPDALNLWQGFGVQAKPGSWSLMKSHLLGNVCSGNQEHFSYLHNWMADLVQFPGKQAEVAIVMRGIEGCGKGTPAKALQHLFGQHGFSISNSKHLTGNFNAHLRDAVVVFADEAFFAGDRAHTNVLKALITEPFLAVEAKYQNAVQTPNFVHLIMASNEHWVVPASLDSRRFFVLDVAPTRANDHAYFGALWDEMKHGGYEAMLHDLMHHDLTEFNIRCVPMTDGLQDQRKLSLGTSEAWWMETLQRGYVFQSRHGLEDYFGEWHDIVSTEVLMASYSEFAKNNREWHPMSRERLGVFMRKMGARPIKPQTGVVGEHIVNVPNSHGGSDRTPTTILKDRPPSYRLGDLEAARLAFVAATKLSVQWSGADADVEG